ncbi:MAG: hypothetical protein J5U19_14725, partial [Candidatus Methanoperedens sp.]|nr:hypothetical protein [Candidatus Methanoperedens sp.]
KMAPILDDAQDKVITQMSNFLPGNAEGIDFIASFNESIISTLNEEGAVTKEKISGTLISYLQEISKQETHEHAKNEIKALVTDLVDMYVDGAMTIDEFKDRILTETFSRISISRVQATLSIWEKRI